MLLLTYPQERGEASMQYYSSYAEILTGAMSVVFSIISVIGIVFYIFSSIGLYTIAKRRRIPGAGWAWVPLGNLWILGSIADQYDLVVKNVKKKQRHLLLWLSISIIALVIAMIPTLLAFIFSAAQHSFNSSDADALIGTVLIMVIFYIGLLALAVISAVFTYIAYYKLYKSCAPDNAVLFLVLSIFFSFLTPFFVFACRNKDEGLYAPAQPPYPPYSAPQAPYYGNHTPQA